MSVARVPRPAAGCTSRGAGSRPRRLGASGSGASSTSSVETLPGVRPSVESQIRESLGHCLDRSTLPWGTRVQGKVRDTYALADKLVIVTTDRQSAFDRYLASVPFKGQVLNQTSAWWMAQTSHIVPNALEAIPHPNAAVMTKCTVFPVEFVVRGFLTGSTDTSLWTHYAAGERHYCGETFPDGLRKNARLPRNVLTPTTKAVEHDEPVSPRAIVERGLMSGEDLERVQAAALALFEYGQKVALKRGLLLVDTKYEFGKNERGEIMLVDEIHTPDSSRYWMADTYEARHAQGLEPQNIDKEFLRLWFRANCDPYHDKVLPAAPDDLVVELARRYVLLHDLITDTEFVPLPNPQASLEQEVGKALNLV
ncbi:phosphoribosylaminoimidazole-succinocarboxamide synthase [Helicosporidium sp. ATCC 50920]|nr:phosphoribosylaminoimidazole-succinocarboxamide synthase [Helicosporidium sp. ATCC 50920]|eukprot:KDD76057.1 phosphoribosylaminoimidazole-succinocarboxamide synthase [Helicosporidium sp. ATCC 50920]